MKRKSPAAVQPRPKSPSRVAVLHRVVLPGKGTPENHSPKIQKNRKTQKNLKTHPRSKRLHRNLPPQDVPPQKAVVGLHRCVAWANAFRSGFPSSSLSVSMLGLRRQVYSLAPPAQTGARKILLHLNHPQAEGLG
ncbi:hypothetical protein K2E96_27345 [Pseudomonas sp. ERGC3:05]|nr:hypothetical protein [Pseudomonas sp. ERGC3:01]QZC94389.1 hypothetical protein K2E96_27345 [Pseudomonas sp. ERGC3:05]